MAEPDDLTQTDRDRAEEPNDLERLFIARANARDLEGLMALFEPDAAMRASGDRIASGHRNIRDALEGLLAEQRGFVLGDQQPALVSGDLALTSTRLANGAVTAEVARRQPDGTWLWAIDRYNILE
jgi:ketosteroid isomerase-like protein